MTRMISPEKDRPVFPENGSRHWCHSPRKTRWPLLAQSNGHHVNQHYSLRNTLDYVLLSIRYVPLARFSSLWHPQEIAAPRASRVKVAGSKIDGAAPVTATRRRSHREGRHWTPARRGRARTSHRQPSTTHPNWPGIHLHTPQNEIYLVSIMNIRFNLSLHQIIYEKM